MKWKISTQVILRRGEGFNEQELLYFVVFFESVDLIYRTRETFGTLTVIKTLYFSYVFGSLSVKLTILAEAFYLSKFHKNGAL